MLIHQSDRRKHLNLVKPRWRPLHRPRHPQILLMNQKSTPSHWTLLMSLQNLKTLKAQIRSGKQKHQRQSLCECDSAFFSYYTPVLKILSMFLSFCRVIEISGGQNLGWTAGPMFLKLCLRINFNVKGQRVRSDSCSDSWPPEYLWLVYSVITHDI